MMAETFRITYAARSFLDYRVPVLRELDRLCGDGLRVLYSSEFTPERVCNKIQATLGERAQGLTGERRIGPAIVSGFANRGFRVVYQPGLSAAIRSTQPDVVVGDGFFQWTSFLLAQRIRRGTPLVVCYERTFHTERNAQRLRTSYRRLALRFIDAMAVNGRLSRDYTEWLGMPRDRITTGQMVADVEGIARSASAVTNEERAAIRARWDNPDLVFLVSSRLIELKGLREFLPSWGRLERGQPVRCRLVIVGGGHLEAELHAQAEALGLQHVTFTGPVDYEEMARYYAAADALVIPTLEDNWSLVVPEAMACGLPVLSSCYNGCHPELVEPGGNGWIFDPLDEQDTLGVLMRCVEQRNRLQQMGRHSREIVALHTPTHAAQSILDACRIAVAHRGR